MTSSAAESGHSLLELVTVLAVLGLCLAGGGIMMARGLGSVEARGAAQSWQAAAAWAQTGAIWQGTSVDVEYDSGRIAVEAAAGTSGADLGASAPPVPAVPNIVRWSREQGVVVRFSGGTGHPDSAGSLYFRAPGDDYRVTVRLESGLTVRTKAEAP